LNEGFPCILLCVVLNFPAFLCKLNKTILLTGGAGSFGQKFVISYFLARFFIITGGIKMTHITKLDTTIYEVNGKTVDVSEPQYGKNLKNAAEYKALRNYVAAIERQKRLQIEEENRHLFD